METLFEDNFNFVKSNVITFNCKIMLQCGFKILNYLQKQWLPFFFTQPKYRTPFQQVPNIFQQKELMPFVFSKIKLGMRLSQKVLSICVVNGYNSSTSLQTKPFKVEQCGHLATHFPFYKLNQTSMCHKQVCLDMNYNLNKILLYLQQFTIVNFDHLQQIQQYQKQTKHQQYNLYDIINIHLSRSHYKSVMEIQTSLSCLLKHKFLLRFKNINISSNSQFLISVSIIKLIIYRLTQKKLPSAFSIHTCIFKQQLTLGHDQLRQQKSILSSIKQLHGI
ncbi:unnamed protein product (macronuclear) [Paramecium tetraurelia]|uniref:Transmembrane protein n=1 Tax=Paramecium tetraurelia TaxID=5888 RepID=A0DDI0_PARTE|nr:uncharacterized protein GSPATT00015957001 [Paramecium tetraurelia]CAK81097.1 unnamed protein product [Paramecium tetraurelia]|eukprot:XP_001448494.1 hypothetical protein (macronuclear) [Paramecium tetraurelia strain d4-2]